MQEFKGSKGTWRYLPAFGEVKSEKSGLIADLVVNGNEDENGRLIAAAPELLEALQDAIHAHDKHGEQSEWDFARTAIAKALGQ